MNLLLVSEPTALKFEEAAGPLLGAIGISVVLTMGVILLMMRIGIAQDEAGKRTWPIWTVGSLIALATVLGPSMVGSNIAGEISERNTATFAKWVDANYDLNFTDEELLEIRTSNSRYPATIKIDGAWTEVSLAYIEGHHYIMVNGVEINSQKAK